MTLTQLSYITEVYRHRSFGQAAEACGVTQPTLSMQIQKLEEELNVTLFDRAQKPIKATPLGEKIIEQAFIVLKEAQKIDALIHQEEQELSGDISLAIIPTLAPYLLPLFLGDFLKKYPKVRLHIEEIQTTEIIEALKFGRLDFGLLATPLNQNSIIERPLFYEPFMAYLPEGHQLLSSARVSQRDLSLDELLLLDEGHCFREQAMEICQRSRKDSNKTSLDFVSGNMETLIRLVDQGVGSTLLPYLAAIPLNRGARNRRLKPFKIPVPSREISLVYSKAKERLAVVEQLSQLIIQSLPKELKNQSKKHIQVVDMPAYET